MCARVGQERNGALEPGRAGLIPTGGECAENRQDSFLCVPGICSLPSWPFISAGACSIKQTHWPFYPWILECKMTYMTAEACRLFLWCLNSQATSLSAAQQRQCKIAEAVSWTFWPQVGTMGGSWSMLSILN